MKRTLIILLTLVLSLAIGTYAFADDTAAVTAPFKKAAEKIRHFPQLVINDEQKAKMIDLKSHMIELKKQIIQSNVDNGTITEDQAKAVLEWLDKRLETIKSGDFKPGKGWRGMRGFHRFQQQHTQTSN